MSTRKTKSKFNKKEGLRFSLLARSQQDPILYEGGSEQVLHPLDRKTALAMQSGAFVHEVETVDYQAQAANKRTKQVNGIKEIREVDEMGFRLDGYNYEQHLSSATEGGTFIGVGGFETSGRLQFDQRKPLPSEAFASEEMLPRRVDLEAILLAPELMDDDMKQQLEEEVDEAEVGAEVEWADEFIGQLLGPSPEEELAMQGKKPMTSKMVQGFDFDAHMSRLMRDPRANQVEGDFEDGFDDEFDYEDEEQEEEEEFEGDADAHFAAVLAEYEQADAMEECDDDDEAADGATQIGAPHLSQSDPMVLRALEIYNRDQEDDSSLGEVGLPPCKDEILKFVRPETLEEEEIDMTKKPEQPTMEAYMKAWGSYQITEKPRFDCETIVSTRSTTDNLPSVIALPQRAPRKRMDAVREEEEEENEEEELNAMAARMRLATEQEEEEPVGKSLLGDSTKRKRDETKEEKRARKAQLKEEKRERRQEKKEVKSMYKEEKKQVVSCLTARNAPLPGVSEFKI